jgi:hypothetical protein
MMKGFQLKNNGRIFNFAADRHTVMKKMPFLSLQNAQQENLV